MARQKFTHGQTCQSYNFPNATKFLKILEEFKLLIESHHQIYVLLLSKVLRFYSSFNKRNESAQVMRKKKVRAYAFYKKTNAPFVVTA